MLKLTFPEVVKQNVGDINFNHSTFYSYCKNTQMYTKLAALPIKLFCPSPPPSTNYLLKYVQLGLEKYLK